MYAIIIMSLPLKWLRVAILHLKFGVWIINFLHKRYIRKKNSNTKSQIQRSYKGLVCHGHTKAENSFALAFLLSQKRARPWIIKIKNACSMVKKWSSRSQLKCEATPQQNSQICCIMTWQWGKNWPLNDKIGSASDIFPFRN